MLYLTKVLRGSYNIDHVYTFLKLALVFKCEYYGSLEEIYSLSIKYCEKVEKIRDLGVKLTTISNKGGQSGVAQKCVLASISHVAPRAKVLRGSRAPCTGG